MTYHAFGRLFQVWTGVSLRTEHVCRSGKHCATLIWLLFVGRPSSRPWGKQPDSLEFLQGLPSSRRALLVFENGNPRQALEF